MKKLLVVFALIIMMLSSCQLSDNRNSRDSDNRNDKVSRSKDVVKNDNDNDSEDQSMNNHFDQIRKLIDKISEEANSFYTSAQPFGQQFPTSVCALTQAINNAIRVKECLENIENGENVTGNIQNIDGECLQMENYCKEGIEQLGDSDNEDNDFHIGTSFKENWISVLNRIKDYSIEIRESVQEIRENQ